MGVYRIFLWHGGSERPTVTTWYGRESAVAMAQYYVRNGASLAVVVSPEGRLIDTASPGEGVSLDAVLGRGRHDVPTDPAV